jgi:hypothetical protein
VIPTAIANAFFMPRHLLVSAAGSKVPTPVIQAVEEGQ